MDAVVREVPVARVTEPDAGTVSVVSMGVTPPIPAGVLTSIATVEVPVPCPPSPGEGTGVLAALVVDVDESIVPGANRVGAPAVGGTLSDEEVGLAA